MFNKVRVSKFLLCTFGAGLCSNLVGHATVESENINSTEGDAQKDSNIYVEKSSGELGKNFIYIDVDENDSNSDLESSSKESRENIKKFVKEVCGNRSSKVRKIVFGTSSLSMMGGGIYLIIHHYMRSPYDNPKDSLKAFEEKGISVKFLDDKGNEVPVEGENKNTAENEKKTDVVNSNDDEGSSKETQSVKSPYGDNNSSGNLDDKGNEVPVEEENKNTAENEKKTDVVNSDDDEGSSKETQSVKSPYGDNNSSGNLDDKGNEVPVEEENKNTAENEKKTDVVNSDNDKNQDLNTTANQTERSGPSDALNQDVKNSEKGQIVNMGLKEWLFCGGLFVIFVAIFVICYICRKAKKNSLNFKGKMKIVSLLGQSKGNPIFLYYHEGESGATEEEKEQDKQGYSASNLMTTASTGAINRRNVYDDSVLDLTGRWFKMRKGDFLSFYNSFDKESKKLSVENFQNLLVNQNVTDVFLYVDSVSGANLHFKVNIGDLNLDFYASINAISETYIKLREVLTKPDSSSTFVSSKVTSDNNGIFGEAGISGQG